MGDVVRFPEAGAGIEPATEAALWILGRTHQADGAERAAKLALGFLLAGAAVVRSEYGPDYAGWLLLALAQEHGRVGREVDRMRDRLAVLVLDAQHEQFALHRPVRPLRVPVAVERDLPRCRPEARRPQRGHGFLQDARDLLL